MHHREHHVQHAVRKTIATCFSTEAMKKAFPGVRWVPVMCAVRCCAVLWNLESYLTYACESHAHARTPCREVCALLASMWKAQLSSGAPDCDTVVVDSYMQKCV